MEKRLVIARFGEGNGSMLLKREFLCGDGTVLYLDHDDSCRSVHMIKCHKTIYKNIKRK